RGLAARAWEEAARHLERQAEMLWSLWLGEEAPPTEEPPDFLFEPATARAVERVAVHEDDELGQYRRLFAFLAGEVIGRATKAEDERLRELRFELLARLRAAANGSEAAERRRLAGEVLDASQELLPLLEAQRAALEAATRALGWDSPFALLGALAGASPGQLLGIADAVLEPTAAPSRRALRAAAAPWRAR